MVVMGTILKINSAVLTTPKATALALGQVPAASLGIFLPELNILGEALKESGVSNANQFIRALSELEQATSHPVNLEDVQRKMLAVVEGINNPELWERVQVEALQHNTRRFAPSGSIAVVFRQKSAKENSSLERIEDPLQTNSDALISLLAPLQRAKALIQQIEKSLPRTGSIPDHIFTKAHKVFEILMSLPDIQLKNNEKLGAAKSLLIQPETQRDGLGEIANIVRQLERGPRQEPSLPVFIPDTQPAMSTLWRLSAMSFGFGMGMHLTQRLTLRMALPIGPTNWQVADVYESEGGDLVYLTKTRLPVAGLPLEERLAIVDKANVIFHYAYRIEKDENGKQVFYKIPLMRDQNVRIEDIGIKISKAEHERARFILEGSGGVQRIVRAVPYVSIRTTILRYLNSQGVGLDQVVLIGIDRGGRLPTILTREALGLPIARFLKVDQGSGRVDEGRLSFFARQGIFRGKYLLFVDSTVDSGRQISALAPHFEDPSQHFGHLGWVVIGSNENGRTLEHHVNVNWGVDPDQTFEDNPNLLGMDYVDDDDLTKVKAVKSTASRDIRRAFLEIPKGIGLDLSEGSLKIIKVARKGIQTAEKAVRTKTWRKISDDVRDDTAKSLPVVDLTNIERPREPVYPTQKLAIIGGKDEGYAFENGAQYLSLALSDTFSFHIGTSRGAPRMIVDALHENIPSAQFTIYKVKKEDSGRPSPEEIHGGAVLSTGSTKEEKRFNMIMKCDAVLILPGNEGTLMEAIIALEAGKKVIAIRHWGAVARYLESSRRFKNLPNLHFVSSLTEAVTALRPKN